MRMLVKGHLKQMVLPLRIFKHVGQDVFPGINHPSQKIISKNLVETGVNFTQDLYEI